MAVSRCCRRLFLGVRGIQSQTGLLRMLGGVPQAIHYLILVRLKKDLVGQRRQELGLHCHLGLQSRHLQAQVLHFVALFGPCGRRAVCRDAEPAT